MKFSKSFTLIEIIIYTVVLFIVMNAIVFFLIWMMRSNNKSGAMREVLDNKNRIAAVMANEIKSAKSIYSPTMISTQISLETTNNLPSGEEKTFIDFYLASSTIFLKRESQDPIPLNTDSVLIKNLNFSVISSTTTFPSVRIEMEIEYKNPGNRPEDSASISATSTVSLRSY